VVFKFQLRVCGAHDAESSVLVVSGQNQKPKESSRAIRVCVLSQVLVISRGVADEAEISLIWQSVMG
jgi:hypothetical protein